MEDIFQVGYWEVANQSIHSKRKFFQNDSIVNGVG
jgi:hypothetical protein